MIRRLGVVGALVVALALGAVVTVGAGSRNIDGYRLELTVEEPDGTQAVKDGGATFDTAVLAIAAAARVNRDGFCEVIEGSPDLAAICYPTPRIVRIRILIIYG